MSTLTDSLTTGEPPLPWIYELGAALAGEDAAALTTDAGVLSRSLADAADLFDLSAACVSFDVTLEAEALGCDISGDAVTGFVETPDDAFEVNVDAAVSGGRVPEILDATERLVDTLDCSVVGGLTEPGTLADALLADPGDADAETREEAIFTAGDAGIALANAYLDRGVEGIAVLAPDGLSADEVALDALSPLVNVLDHYGAAGVVVARELSIDSIEAAADFGLDAVTGRVADPEEAVAVANDAGIVLGVGVPGETFTSGPASVEEYVASLPSGALVSSEWTVPPGTDPTAIHDLMGSLG